MSIKTEIIDATIKNGKELLQKKTLGGVTTESAQKAIENVARNVEDIGNKEIAKIRMQLNAEKGDLHRQLVEMTNKKDSAEFHLKQVTNERDRAAEALKNVSEGLNAARKTKVGKPKINSNGNVEVTKSNKNGARMTVEYAQNEAKTPLSYTVEDIDGYVRKTTLNPATGKPIKTYTDTNGGHNYEYLPNGTKVKRVNVKKASDKPVKTTKQTLEENRDWLKFQQNYSDGSYEIIDYSKQKSRVVKSVKINAEGKKIGEKELDHYNGKAGYKTWELNPETGKQTKFSRKYDLGDGQKFEDVKYYAEDGMTVIKSKYVLPSGMKRVAKAKVDEFGFQDANHPIIEYTYPKTSPIKTAKFEFDNQYCIGKEKLKLKDGTQVLLKINDSHYKPVSATINKNGTETVIDDYKKLEGYLEEIGYRKGYSGNNFYTDYTSTNL